MSLRVTLRAAFRAAGRTWWWASVPMIMAVGCEDPTAAAPALGVYVLADVAGNPLPAVAGTTEFRRFHVLADTLRLRPEGLGTVTGLRETEVLGVDGAPTGKTQVRLEHGFRYRVIAKRIVEIAFDCPPNANCSAPPHLVGRLTPDGLRVTYAGGLRVPLHYVRLTGAT